MNAILFLLLALFPADTSTFLDDLSSSDADRRQQAVAAASDAGVAALAGVVDILDRGEPDVRKTATQALSAIAHAAGAPGASTQRDAFARYAVERIAPSSGLTPDTRLALLRGLASLARTPAEVAAISARLDDPALTDAAQAALVSISHPSATHALVDRLDHPRRVPRTVILRALGARGDARALPALLPLARGADAKLAAEARRALARIGDARALKPLLAAARRGIPGAEDDLLRLTDAIASSGDPAVAKSLYQRFLRSDTPHLRAAGARGLGDLGHGDATSTLLAAAGDADIGVRGAARNALVRLRGDGVDEAVIARLTDRDGVHRAALLRVLDDRGRLDTATLLYALESDDAALRGAAIKLARDHHRAPITDRLLQLARDADRDEAGAALGAYIRHAVQAAGSGSRRRALDMAHQALALDTNRSATDAAVRLVASIGAPSSLPLLDRPGLDASSTELDRARVAIADSLPTDEAIALLDRVLAQTGSRDVRRTVASELSERGIDTSAIAARSGFITRWHLLGTLPEAGSADELATLPFDAAAPVDGVVQDGDATLEWRLHETEDLDGMIDLTQLFDKTSRVSAFAVAEVTVPTAMEGMLKIGSDDGVAAWVNGEKLHVNHVSRGVTVDQDVVRCSLRPGTNRVILRVNQGGGGWGFCVRLADQDGAAVDLARREI